MLRAVVDRLHHGAAVRGFARCDQRRFFAGDRIEKCFKTRGLWRGEIRPGGLAVGLERLAGDEKLAVDHRCERFGSADLERHRIRDIVPTGGEGAEDAGLEFQNRLAGFFTVFVTRCSVGDRAGG